jgi:heme-degrading monooxygenase HmoA
MITRIWHGRTLTKDATEYRNFVIETGISDYKSIPGNIGAQIWQKEEGDITHIYTVSWWDNYDSIKQFAEKILRGQSITRRTNNIYWNLNRT